MITGVVILLSIKSQIMADADIFFNVDEFAEVHTVELEGVQYQIPVIVEKEAVGKYEKQWDGVYQATFTVFFRKSDVARSPVREQIFGLDGKQYIVVDCKDDIGVVEVDLAVPEG